MSLLNKEERLKMEVKKNNKKMVSALLVVALTSVFALFGCSSDPYAVKINGVEIKESKITNYIEQIRESYSLTDADSWGNYLSQSSMTPSSLRDQILDNYIEQEIVKQYANEKDCDATQEEIDKQVAKVREYYSDDDAWKDALKSAGFADENDYRDILKYSIGYEKLEKKFSEEATVEDSAVLEEAKSKMDTLNGGKKSSQILFESSDEATAKEVLEKVRSGELDFAEAAKQYSTDTSSAEDGGNVGWDKDTTFVDAYQNALNGLEKDQISDLVTSDYGIHIIKCTAVFTKPDKTDALEDFPSDYVDDMRESVKETQGSTDCTNWISEKKESANIDKKDMPSDVSYNVDMSKYGSSDSSSDSADTSSESGDASSDSTASTEGETSESSDTTSSDTTTNTESTTESTTTEESTTSTESNTQQSSQ